VRADLEPALSFAVNDVTRRDSGTHVLAAFDVASGKPCVAR